jgi:hypothetical protein
MRTRGVGMLILIVSVVITQLASHNVSAQGPIRRRIQERRAVRCCKQECWCKYQRDLCKAYACCDQEVRCLLINAAYHKYQSCLKKCCQCCPPPSKCPPERFQTCREYADSFYAGCIGSHSEEYCNALVCLRYWECVNNNTNNWPEGPPPPCFEPEEP